MTLNEFKERHSDEYESIEDTIQAIIMNAIYCAKRHHSTCMTGEGAEATEVYSDLAELFHDNEYRIRFEK